MQSRPPTIVVLGTGGTIAGEAEAPTDNVGYRAAQRGVEALIAGLSFAATDVVLEAEQVAQIDSKDMGPVVWRALAERCAAHLARSEVVGLVVTHGTDTLEETAWFLQRVLGPRKPVVLTAAMRPATALAPDGPQNLRDALAVACVPGAFGVVAVLAGRVFGARDVRKVHPYRLDAFAAGDAGALGVVEEGVLRRFRDWPPAGAPIGTAALPAEFAAWPSVEIVTSHAGAGGTLVRALRAAGVHGIVVAGSGNGSIHHELEAALIEARAAGVAVLRATRCADGSVIDGGGRQGLESAGDLTPVKARVELLLRLLEARGRPP